MHQIKLSKFAIDDRFESFYTRKLHAENSNDLFFRSYFESDKHRIINSSAFRRLQYKTQVFVNHQGDHYRTRLTHTLEVAQISRWIAGAISANQDLAEIISLAHDLGHPPFGHAGERCLNQMMKDFGGFSHNIHTLKLITKIENRLLNFEGLNLTFATLEGIVKHNGPIANINDLDGTNYIQSFNQLFDLELTKNPSIEAQISAISDDIAYNNHDLEDGLRAKLFGVEELFDLPIVGKIYQQILSSNSNIRQELLTGECKEIITAMMVRDVIEQTQKNINEFKIANVEDVRNSSNFIVQFSKSMNDNHLAIKKFLMNKMYHHDLVNDMTKRGEEIIKFLFSFHFAKPQMLPIERYELYAKNPSPQNLAEIICDFIAGMTDRFAIKIYNEIRRN